MLPVALALPFVEEALLVSLTAVGRKFLGSAVRQFVADEIIGLKANSENSQISLSKYQKYRDTTLKSDTETVSTENQKIPTAVKESVKNSFDTFLQNVYDDIDNFSSPDITTHEPEQKTTTSSSTDSLVDVLIKNNDSTLEAIHEQSKVLESIQSSLKIIADNVSLKSELEKQKIAQMALENTINQHKLELLSSTLPDINHSLAYLPVILQALDIIAQNSTVQSDLHIRANQNRYDIAVNTMDLANTHKKVETHQQKQADLADFDLSHEVTDSAGNKTTPAKARAQKHAEESLSHKLENSITPDDLDISDMDLNIFAKVAEIMENKEETNNAKTNSNSR